MVDELECLAKRSFSRLGCRILVLKLIITIIVLPALYLSPRNYCENGNWVLKPFTCDNGCGNASDGKICPQDEDFTIGMTKENPPGTLNIPVKLEDEAVIQSPGFPNLYVLNINLLWNVTTVPGYRIRVIFTAFYLENTTDCKLDYLTLHDGISLNSPVLETLCDYDKDSLLEPITSSSNSMVLRFRIDTSFSYEGFQLVLSTVCGGTLQAGTSKNVLVSHPKYGQDGYASNLTCDWIITSGGPERNVQISFSDFDLAKPFLTNDSERLPEKTEVSGCENSISGNCVQYYEDSEADGPKDFVEIFDGPDDSSSRFGKYYSNRMPPSVTSRGEKLLVRFRSGGKSHYRGFRAVYKEV